MIAKMKTNIQLTKNFNLNEFVRTNTGLDNNPTSEALENITKLSKILQQIRDEYGKPIRILKSDKFYTQVSITCERNDIIWELICHFIAIKKLHLRKFCWMYGSHISPEYITIQINSVHYPYMNNVRTYIDSYFKNIQTEINPLQ